MCVCVCVCMYRCMCSGKYIPVILSAFADLYIKELLCVCVCVRAGGASTRVSTI